jgi:hypothetical protein
MLAMDVNDNACLQVQRVVMTFFASMLAPTESFFQYSKRSANG